MILDKFKIKNSLYFIVMGFITFTLIGFSAKKQQDRICDKIVINVDKEFQNVFIDNEDVEKLLTEDNQKIIKGLSKDGIDLHYYESLINQSSYVKKSIVSIGHTGTLHVEVIPNRPIARIFEGSKGYYIDNEGKTIPLSRKYTARLPIVILHSKNVDKKNEFFTSKTGESYLLLLNKIREDVFWSKQVSEIEIDAFGEVKLRFQVGKQEAHLGTPENLENKFFRLNVFVKKILPSVGWNKYEKVILKYENQIVCE